MDGITAVSARVEVGAAPPPQSAARSRPIVTRVRTVGKFLYVEDEKFLVHGVTYGAFRPDANGNEYTDSGSIHRDFAQMAACGVNTVRIPHTVPPRALLDAAQQHGLRVMVGLSAEQFAGFLIDTKNRPDVDAIIRAKVRSVAGHPALLCYAVGNEISAALARWIGSKRIERYIRRIYRIVKEEDPAGLVTYVNYPTTEYLDLPFLDLVCFNVYLESPEAYSAYLMRLQNIAGERPLLMSEIGLDSLRNGEQAQAESLAWQIRIAHAAGCAGTIVFSWTDEWHRAEAEVEDWAFGLTKKDRTPKPALAALQKAFAQAPFAPDTPWPRVSVVVCTYNGSATIRETLEALRRLDYPDFEVIVVNDGSTDATPQIVSEYDVRTITTENRGLSSARNTGWQAATGEIVAYIDDDAYPDPHWLKYLAHAFMTTTHVGIGGPNIPPPGDGWVAQSVANAPGGPIHVLLTDTLAEHIPGCNMAFRRSALAAVGGFDVRYRTAGDDVDICWQLQQAGGTLGFHAAAVVWHHRRNSVRAYLKQQAGYGRAEALLETKWPERYNGLGHLTWHGRVYGNGHATHLWNRQRIYHGVMGTAPFQLLYQQAPGALASILFMPELYLGIAALAAIALLGLIWPPLAWAAPVVLGVIALLVVNATLTARAGLLSRPDGASSARRRVWMLSSFLHVAQPIVRLWGRFRHGLTPWRARPGSFAAPIKWSTAVWTMRWAPPESRPESVERDLAAKRVRIVRGGPYDRWDLEVPAGLFGSGRALIAVEDHGGGAQYIRARVWPRFAPLSLIGSGLFAGLAAAAAADGAWPSAALLAAVAAVIAGRAVYECAYGVGGLRRAIANVSQTLWSDKP